MAKANTDDTKAGAAGDGGAGGGDQKQSASAGAGADAGAGKDAAGRNLSVDDIGAIAESVGEALGLTDIKASVGTLGQTIDGLKSQLSTEITAAVTRQLAKAMNKADKTGGADKGSVAIDKNDDPLAIQVKVGKETLTVADLIESKQKAEAREAELAKQDEQRAEQDKVRRVADAMRVRNFAGLIDVLAKGLASTISIDPKTNELVAKDVTKTNSLGTKVRTDMPLEEYLNMLATENPTMILDKTKTGSGAGGGDGGAGGPAGTEFTGENAMKNIDVFEKWMGKDPVACQQAVAAYQDGLANKH